MADFGSVMQGFIIMIVLNLIALFMVFNGGMMIDTMHDTLTGQHIYDVPAQWSASGEVFSLINIFYFICYALSPIGIGVFLFTIIRQQQYDEYNQYGGYS